MLVVLWISVANSFLKVFPIGYPQLLLNVCLIDYTTAVGNVKIGTFNKIYHAIWEAFVSDIFYYFYKGVYTSSE